MRRDEDIFIHQYRGFDIFYKEDSEKFTCEMVVEDNFKETSRVSLKAVKQEVDAFIKSNLNFKPFKIMFFDRFQGECDVRNVTGVRSDGSIVMEYKAYGSDRKDFLKKGHYDEKKAKIWNPDLLDIEKEYKEHEEIWQKKRRELEKKADSLSKPIDWKYVEGFKKKV